MDIYHDTSLRSILEDDSISLASKACIHSCSSKRAGLWLGIKSSISLFRITHFIFNSALCFRLDLVQPSTFSLLKCECGHKLDTFGTHLTRCLFKGQWITTHDAIQNVMYALTQEQWYTFISRISL
jgi:hypothetical protein